MKTRSFSSPTASSASSAMMHDAILAEAYDRYVGYIAKMGFRLLGRPDEVDDLIQDVFVVAVERLSHLKNPDALKSWLASITARLALRRLRRRRLRRFLSLDDGSIDSQDIATFLSQHASVESALLLEQVFVLLDGVDPTDRLAWSFRVLEGEPLENVAALCGCSLSTAKRRIAATQAILDRELGA